MPRGPLPEKNTRRRNAPTIPTTKLPAKGYDGEVPEAPESYELGDAGQAFWEFAWSLPQAAAWDDAAIYGIARRAQLEDYLVALEDAEMLDIDELLAYDEEQQRQMLRRLEFVIRKLAGMARGSVSAMKEMRELDNKFGLNPAAMAALRWEIIDADDKPQQAPAPPSPGKKSGKKRAPKSGKAAADPRARLSVVA